jgi:hypothetical protein
MRFRCTVKRSRGHVCPFQLIQVFEIWESCNNIINLLINEELKKILFLLY